jgi:hypothetical protein
LADNASEELAKRGKAVDPSAKVGVRIELSGAKRTQRKKSSGVQFVGNIPPGELQDVYEVEGRVYLFSVENRSASKVPAVTVMKVSALTDPNWEPAIGKAIGKEVGMLYIPQEGCYDAEGKDAVMSQAVPLGIDGVLEIPPR